MLFQEMMDEADDIRITYALVGISVAMILCISCYNFFQTPDSNIFINYEEFAHQSL